MSSKLDIAREVAFHFLGKPYIWGGDDPSGFDCSGYVIEILKSIGLLPGSGDWTAAMLKERFKDYQVERPYQGCLVFWANTSGHVIHVEYCLSDDLSIGAAGGGSSTVSEAEAWRRNAYIKVRPMRNRKGIAGYVDPYQVLWQ